jgi:hypothetical protein
LQSFGKWLKYCAFWALTLAATQRSYEYALGQENKPVEVPAKVTEDNAGRPKTLAQQPPETTAASIPAESPPKTAGNGSEKQPSQQASSLAAAQSNATKPTAVVEEPPVYYVRDKQGRLIPLLGFSYEEILSLIQQKKTGQIGTPAPHGYSLEQLEITGEAEGERAKLIADYKINLTESDWVDVPLWNKGAVLEEPATYRGEADHQIQYNSQTGAYVARLRGAAGSQVQITLKLAVPIKTTGIQSKLDFDVPTAAASRLSLRVPQSPLEMISHTGCTTAEAKSGGTRSEHRSEIILRGLGGPVELAWQEHALENTSGVLEATGQVFAQIDSRSVQFDVLLTVRGFGAQFDRFRVKLPPGSQLVGGAPVGAGYTLNSLTLHKDDQTQPSDPATAEKTDDEPHADWVEVHLAQPTAEPVEVRIQAERAYDVTKPDTILELSGFEVQEAAPHRQWGHIAVAVVGDWRVAWGLRERVRQVAELPAALQRPGIVAGFEYFGQPASLTARIVPRQTRISVEPQYVYFVAARQVQLEARLKYNIRGAKASALEIAIPGWEIDSIGPTDVVDANAPLNSRGTSTIVPLTKPTTGEIELSLKAHRNLPAATSRLEVSMPQPAADVVGPALVVLLPADNVRLRAREDELQGMVHPSVTPRLNLPVREQAPLIYRDEQTQATFVGDLELLPQVIRAGIATDVKLQHDEIQVDQRFAYHVEHEPTSSLTFAVPETLLKNTNLEWKIDDQILVPLPSPAPSADSKTVRIELPLAEPRQGAFEVVARYHAPHSQWNSDPDDALGGPLVIPLVMPTIASLDHNRAAIYGESAARVQSLDEAWKVVDESSEPNAVSERAELRLTASQAVPQIVLIARPGAEREAGGTVVDRAWIQSWLSGPVRQDRAVYRISTSGDELGLSLPAGISAGNLELQLDHRMVQPIIASDGTLKLNFPRSSENRYHVLELRYQWDHYEGHSHSINVELPRFADGVWVQRMYWQLVLPTNEHLVVSPADFTPEFNWKWSGLGWGRHATWDQSELEKWSGAAAADALPEATNRYLFSTIGSPLHFTAATATRWQIVLLSSAAALAVGLLVLYVPSGRRPLALLGIGVFMFVLSACLPNAVILFVQSATLGLLLILLAGLLRHGVTRRRAVGRVVAGGGSSIVDRSSVRRKTRPLELAGASTSASETLDLPAAGSQHA